MQADHLASLTGKSQAQCALGLMDGLHVHGNGIFWPSNAGAADCLLFSGRAKRQIEQLLNN